MLRIFRKNRKKPGAVQDVLHGRDPLRRIDEVRRIVRLVGEESVGERPQPALARERTGRLARRAVGLVEVLELDARARALDATHHLLRHVAALRERAQDELAPLLELAHVLGLVAHRAQGPLVEAADVVAAVAREVGDRVARAHEVERAGHDLGVELPPPGDALGDDGLKTRNAFAHHRPRVCCPPAGGF